MISLTGTNFGSTITAQGSSGALAVTIAGKLCGSLSMVTANTLIKCQLVPPLALESCLIRCCVAAFWSWLQRVSDGHTWHAERDCQHALLQRFV